jgi:hypothetical protein
LKTSLDHLTVESKPWVFHVFKKVKIFPNPGMPAWELNLSMFYWNILELVGTFRKIPAIVGLFRGC